MLAAMKVAVLCVVALAGAVKAGSGSGSSGSGSGSGSELEAADATTKADYTHATTAPPAANATTAPSHITTAGYTTAPPAANATTAPSVPSYITTAGHNAGRVGVNATGAAADTTAAAADSNATAATPAAADTTAFATTAAAASNAAATDAAATTAADAAATTAAAPAAATTTLAASAGTTVAPKMIERKEERQSAKFAVSMEKDDCDKLEKSPEDVKKAIEAVAAAAKVDASKLDLGASKAKCVAPASARRQRRAAVNLEVTLVFKKDVSAADVAAAVAVANELIKAGGFEVTVTIGGESKTIKVTQTVTQATEVVTVMVPYVPVNGTTATAQPGTTTNAVVNTPKASASLARGSALLVAALAASHALLA